MDKSGAGSDGNEGVLPIPPKLQHNRSLSIRLFRVISRKFFRGGLTTLQISSRCILQPHPTGQKKGLIRNFSEVTNNENHLKKT